MQGLLNEFFVGSTISCHRHPRWLFQRGFCEGFGAVLGLIDGFLEVGEAVVEVGPRAGVALFVLLGRKLREMFGEVLVLLIERLEPRAEVGWCGAGCLCLDLGDFPREAGERGISAFVVGRQIVA